MLVAADIRRYHGVHSRRALLLRVRPAAGLSSHDSPVLAALHLSKLLKGGAADDLRSGVKRPRFSYLRGLTERFFIALRHRFPVPDDRTVATSDRDNKLGAGYLRRGLRGLLHSPITPIHAGRPPGEARRDAGADVSAAAKPRLGRR